MPAVKLDPTMSGLSRKAGLFDLTNVRSSRRFYIMVWSVAISMVVFQFLLVGWSLYHDYQDTIENEKRFFSDIARIADENISGMLQAVDLLLMDVGHEVERRGYSDPEYIKKYMQVRAQSFSYLHTVFLADGSGVIKTATRPELVGMDINDRPYYAELKNDVNGRSSPYYSLLRSKLDGSYRLFIAHALPGVLDKWQGIVGVSIELKTFHELLASVAPEGRSSAVNLISKEGFIIARSQDPEKYLGVSVDNNESHFRFHMNSGERITFKRKRYITDGIERISCARTLSSGAFVVFVSKSAEEILENWRRKAIYRSIAVIASALVLISLARMVVERQRIAVEATLAMNNANEKLWVLSTTDGLTGLANRRHFDQVLEIEWQRCALQKQPLALIMVDVDFFKRFNDLYGHQSGDACLCRIATVLMSHTQRAGALVARYGGEEFAAILPNVDLAQASAWADDVRQAVVELTIAHEASDVGIVSLSMGIAAMIPSDAENVSCMLAAADRALYQAKRKGRNRIEHA
jgi:diguanylate cyclase (GGDEF)-like protein